MCDTNKNKELLEDPEAEALAVAFLYLDGADDRQRERFMYHLTHRYFPEGQFVPRRSHSLSNFFFSQIYPFKIRINPRATIII